MKNNDNFYVGGVGEEIDGLNRVNVVGGHQNSEVSGEGFGVAGHVDPLRNGMVQQKFPHIGR